MNLDKTLGEEMRKQRKMRKLSLAQVADRMGYSSRTTILKMETGLTQITVGMILDFCRAVGCDIEPFVEIIENARLQR